MDRLLATKSEGVGLIVRVISFQDFQPMWSQSTNVTDGQTDRRTDRRHAIPRPCICTKVHCAVKNESLWVIRVVGFWCYCCVVFTRSSTLHISTFESVSGRMHVKLQCFAFINAAWLHHKLLVCTISTVFTTFMSCLCISELPFVLLLWQTVNVIVISVNK